MKRSPPMPFTYGWTTPITAFAAMAASMALPPSSKMWAPACEARNCGVETIPNFETTIERPCPGIDLNCCAAATPQQRNNTARHARRFIAPSVLNTILDTLFHDGANHQLNCCATVKQW